jgi:hypothetical protein
MKFSGMRVVALYKSGEIAGKASCLAERRFIVTLFSSLSANHLCNFSHR